MPPEELAANVHRLREESVAAIRRVVVGMDDIVEQLLICLLAGGHVLLEGVPGTAKTTLCRTFSSLLGIHYERVQFTPDLLPSDVTGTQVLDRASSQFVLRKGPIFCQMLLADELNRAPARTQSALLEAMQEQQVTIEGTTLPLPQPFIVLATQNPIEQEGVYRLPEAQLDRFLFRIEISYPAKADEISMLELHSQPIRVPSAITNPEDVLAIQRQIDTVYASPELLEYIIDVVRTTRGHPDLALGGSPRAAINLMRSARAHALLNRRNYMMHNDVQSVARSVLGHRIILRPEAELDGRTSADVISEVISQVPVLEEPSS